MRNCVRINHGNWNTTSTSTSSSSSSSTSKQMHTRLCNSKVMEEKGERQEVGSFVCIIIEKQLQL